MMAKNELKKGCNLLLTEGADAMYFLIWALQAYKFENIQVEDYGGIKDLTAYLKILKNRAGFEDITKMLIIRDAETDADAAERSICSSLLNSGFTAPNKAGEYEGELPEIAYYLFPGTRTDDRYDNGTLEDLCMNLVDDVKELDLADAYVEKAHVEIAPLTHMHKSKLHAYLAIKNKYVGMKIGEAAKAGAWNWDSVYMEKYKDLMKYLNIL